MTPKLLGHSAGPEISFASRTAKPLILGFVGSRERGVRDLDSRSISAFVQEGEEEAECWGAGL